MSTYSSFKKSQQVHSQYTDNFLHVLIYYKGYYKIDNVIVGLIYLLTKYIAIRYTPLGTWVFILITNYHGLFHKVRYIG